MGKRKKTAPAKREVSEQQRLAALAERESLKEFIQFAKGDPRLTAWEANFVVSMQNFANETPADWRLSEKRVRIIAEIRAKLEKPVVQDADEVEPDDTDPDEAPDPEADAVRDEERWNNLLLVG